jgi:3-deoxy-manno-octulosonate cytidylyltransferase (CMP-KDO synthetase)
VATDDQRILQAVQSFGGETCLTRQDHTSGTDRVAEVAETLRLADDDLVFNVQGDEAEIHPSALEKLLDRCRREDFQIATPAAPFRDDGPLEGPGSPLDPHRVKVVLGQNGRALYFSRSLIPYPRATAGKVDRPSRWLLHLGVYAFHAGVLRALCAARHSSPASRLEETESLEQLRWLEAGWEISVVVVEQSFVGVDTPADYAAFVARHRKGKL